MSKKKTETKDMEVIRLAEPLVPYGIRLVQLACEKIFSGRWIMTVICGSCIVLLTISYVKNPDKELGMALFGLFSTVVTFYFSRSDRK